MGKAISLLVLLLAFNFIVAWNSTSSDNDGSKSNSSTSIIPEKNYKTSTESSHSDSSSKEENDKTTSESSHNDSHSGETCSRCKMSSQSSTSSKASTSTSTTEMTTPSSDTDCDEAYEAYTRAIALYGARFVRAATDEFPVKTILISSWKIFQFLGVDYMFAQGKFETELYKVLGVKDKNKLRCALLRTNKYIDSLRSGSFYRATVNAINSKHYKFTKKAAEEIRLIEGETFEVDFSRKDIDTLNGYLNNQTKGLIGDVIPSYKVANSSTQFLAADALFSIAELSPIRVTGPVTRDFNCAVFNVKAIEYYLVEDYTEHLESEKLMCSITTFNLTAGYRAFLVRPLYMFREKQVLDNIINDVDMWQSELKRMKKEHLIITIPRVDNLNKTFDGTNAVKKFIPGVFDDKGRDVRGYYTGDQSLALTKGYQRINIQTSFVNRTKEAPKTLPKLINLNYPFIYVIQYKGINIFTGILNGCDL